MRENRWISRYSTLCSIEVIDRLAFVPGRAYEPTVAESIGGGAERLRVALDSVYVPTPQSSQVILRELERATAYAQEMYGHERSALGRIYEESPAAGGRKRPGLTGPDGQPESDLEARQCMPTLVTGLSGQGKSAMRRALMRILGDGQGLDLGHDHTLPTLPYACVKVDSRTSEAALLLPLARPEVASGAVRILARELPQACRKWLRQSGVCLYGVDEMQFLTQSTTASAQVSKALLSYATLGVPWHVVMNFSLAWKLMRRPDEVTRRLLGRVAVLVPDPPQSREWSRLLVEWSTVCSCVCAFDLAQQSEPLWNLTAGIKGCFLDLLVLAYTRCRERGARAFNWEDIVGARASASYQSSRDKIDALIRHGVTGAELPEHLQCPFKDESVVLSIKDYQRSLRMARQSTVASAEIRASANASERKALDAAAKAATSAIEGVVEPEVSAKAEVVPIRPAARKKRQFLTAQGLLDGARLAAEVRAREGDKPQP